MESQETHQRGTLGEVARVFLRLGFTAFGGPAAHIALFRDELVTRRKWVSDEQFLDLLGATNPANALAGTLRADYADSFTENGTHGSDSVESAAREIAYFFGEGEVCPRTR